MTHLQKHQVLVWDYTSWQKQDSNMPRIDYFIKGDFMKNCLWLTLTSHLVFVFRQKIYIKNKGRENIWCKDRMLT